MDLSPIIFYLLGGIAIACSFMVILKKNPVASAFSLIMVFFSFAGIYAMLDAHLIAALQIFVYAGAIMVLFIFVIMLLNADTPSFDLLRTHWLTKVVSLFGCILLFSIFVWVFQESNAYLGGMTHFGSFTPERIEEAGGNTQVLSELLFSEYILPFEMTSVLLLASIVGAVAIAKRKGLVRRSE